MSKYYIKSLGNNIRKVRKSQKIPQEKLAEMIGKSGNYVSMVERAEINPPTSVIMQIAIALKVHTKIFYDF